MFEGQVAMRDSLVERIRDSLFADERVSALWLGGSLGRGEGDELSDVDLVAVVSPESIGPFVAEIGVLTQSVGDVALINGSPQNAPRDGAQLNVLYNTDPLPIFVDWNVWPDSGIKPRDMNVLFEREPSSFVVGDTFEAILETVERGVQPKDDDGLCRFRIFMAPIVAKHAARGSFESVDRMLGYMRYDPIEASDFGTVEAKIRGILEECGSVFDDLALACIARYIDTLASAP